MIIIKLIKKMYTPSHTQRQPTLVVFERLSSESHVQLWGVLDSRGGLPVAPVSPALTRLHPSSRVECECVV